MNKQLPPSLVHTITANGTTYLLFLEQVATGYKVTCRNIPNKEKIEQLLKTYLHEEL